MEEKERGNGLSLKKTRKKTKTKRVKLEEAVEFRKLLES